MTFDDFIKVWRNQERAIIAKTSGSTGSPKEICLSKDFMVRSAIRTNTFFKIDDSCRLHSCVSPDFIGGKMMAVRAEIAGASLSWEEPSNRPLSMMPHDTTIDLLAVVPSQMSFLIENIDYLPRIKNIIVGGSAIHPVLRKKISDSGLNAYESYGMTETASHIALRKILSNPSPFQTLPGIKVESGEDNCLVIRFLSGEVFHTNDLAEIISDSEFTIKGRKDGIIVSGGRKINPEVIENKLGQIIHQPFLITGLPDEKWGEKIVMMVERGEQVLPHRSVWREILKPWEMPKEILFVRHLPLTKNGKIKRSLTLNDLSDLDPFFSDRGLCAEVQNMPG